MAGKGSAKPVEETVGEAKRFKFLPKE
jgi:hypothetical protein